MIFPSRLVPLLTVLVLLAPGAGLRAETADVALPRPLTLGAALTYAVAHNPELRRVTSQVAEQEGVLLEASARLKPAVTAGAAYGYTQKSLFESFPGFPDFPKPDSNAWSLDVTLRQVVYSGGAVEGRVRGARARAEAARSAVGAAVNRTLYAVEEDFLGVLLARELIKVREEALAVLVREWEQAKIRHQAGTGSEFDVLRAEVAVANARPALIRARNACAAKQDALRAVLGAEAAPATGSDLDVQGDLAVPAVTLDLAQALETARARRPELQASDALIAAAREDRTVAAAGRRAQVSLMGGYELRKASYPASWGETLNGFTVGAQVEYPIFDGHATEARLRQAGAREAQALAVRDDLRLRVDLEVRDAHRALTEAAQLLEAAGQVIRQAAESLRQAQARAAAGTATQLDVLAAEAAQTEARSNLSQAQHDYALGAARLRRALGVTIITP